MTALDIVMPVFNEGKNIRSVVESLERHVKTPFRLMICYDFEEDDTLPVVRSLRMAENHSLELVRNAGYGVHGAVITGLRRATAPCILVMPADDDYNAPSIDAMVRLMEKGCHIVTPCRFMPGAAFKGAPFLKAILTRSAAWILHNLAFLPTRDATNGFRLFSREVIATFEIESKTGFAVSIELLVKAHRCGFRIAEYPVQWYERKEGKSRFRTLKWIPQYLMWLRYAFATTYLMRRS